MLAATLGGEKDGKSSKRPQKIRSPSGPKEKSHDMPPSLSLILADDWGKRVEKLPKRNIYLFGKNDDPHFKSESRRAT